MFLHSVRGDRGATGSVDITRGLLNIWITHRGWEKEERSSFLKKRSKKLLPISGSRRATQVGSLPPATDKSFLLLFFKKEDLAFAARRAGLAPCKSVHR
jgi:hypothetical protein